MADDTATQFSPEEVEQFKIDPTAWIAKGPHNAPAQAAPPSLQPAYSQGSTQAFPDRQNAYGPVQTLINTLRFRGSGHS